MLAIVITSSPTETKVKNSKLARQTGVTSVPNMRNIMYPLSGKRVRNATERTIMTSELREVASTLFITFGKTTLFQKVVKKLRDASPRAFCQDYSKPVTDRS